MKPLVRPASVLELEETRIPGRYKAEMLWLFVGAKPGAIFVYESDRFFEPTETILRTFQLPYDICDREGVLELQNDEPIKFGFERRFFVGADRSYLKALLDPNVGGVEFTDRSRYTPFDRRDIFDVYNKLGTPYNLLEELVKRSVESKDRYVYRLGILEILSPRILEEYQR